jgi:hypothetical protein
MGSHPTVKLAGPAGEVEIDAELAPVISTLWELGIATRQCCQYNEFSESAEISCPTAFGHGRFRRRGLPGRLGRVRGRAENCRRRHNSAMS